MTQDDAHTSHNHGFELPEAPRRVVTGDARRWRAVAGVAVCLALAGIVTGLIVARRQSVSDEHLTSDALQREELRDGWKALGAAAALDAQAKGVPANAAATAAAAPPNVVVVNVPGPSAPAAPPNVTNINLPSGSATATPAAPGSGSNTSAGYAPNQSLPGLNFSPLPGYLPIQPGYPSTPASNPPETSYLPKSSYDTSSEAVPPLAPAVGNGSIPGSTPNPALPNNGGPTPSSPVVSVQGSPGTSSPPSSAP